MSDNLEAPPHKARHDAKRTAPPPDRIQQYHMYQIQIHQVLAGFPPRRTLFCHPEYMLYIIDMAASSVGDALGEIAAGFERTRGSLGLDPSAESLDDAAKCAS